jgi:flagellin
MSSLLTNSTAMTALQTLRTVSASLAQTQTRVSTGMRVSQAQDNAAYWSIATGMRSDNGALSAVVDSLGLGAATVDTQYTAMTSVLGSDSGGLMKLKNLLVEAKTPGIDRTKIQADITQIQQDMQNMANSATVNGVNWMSVNSAAPGFSPTAQIVSGYSRVGTTPTITTTSVNVNNIKLYDSNGNIGSLDTQVAGVSVANMNISALTDSAADQTTLDGYITQVEGAIASVTQASATLGAVKSRIDSNSNFVKSLQDSLSRGIGQLVDADMNAESTRLQALQVQQQLGVQALSIANAQSQTILSLFK